MKCPNCGHENKRRARHCTRCGKSLYVARTTRRIYVLGAVLIIAILVVGGFALSVASRGLQGSLFGSGSQLLEAAAQRTDEEQEDITADLEIEEDSKGTIGGENEPVDEEPALTGELTDDKAIIDLSGYAPLAVESVDATSVLASKKKKDAYAGASAADGDESTCWQEGREDDGAGEALTFHLGGEHTVRFLLVKLGNWRSDSSYTENGRPQTLTFTFGGESCTVTFPDEKKEHCVTLSKDVTASDVVVRIDEVYAGSKYHDTCVTDIELDGY